MDEKVGSAWYERLPLEMKFNQNEEIIEIS
jgi:hypothetical protein